MSVIDDIKLLPKSHLLNEADTTQGKLWLAFAEQEDEVNVAIDGVRAILEIATASGINLDRLGELLGEPRAGKGDVEYRVFLSIAIMTLASRGDIASLNSLAIALGFENVNIEEKWSTRLLDGTWLLDGTVKLDGDRTPATFTFFRELSVNDPTPDFFIATVFDRTRAAGVDAQIGFTFLVYESDSYVYPIHTGLLDGTWKLDGRIKLDPDKMIFAPNEIAVGDGAQPGGTGPVRPPEGGDSGLQNELLRKDVATLEISPTERVHLMRIEKDELAGNYINEIGIFRDSLPIMIDSFESKSKDALTLYNFKYNEEVA